MTTLSTSIENAALRLHDWLSFDHARTASEQLRDAVRKERGMAPFPTNHRPMRVIRRSAPAIRTELPQLSSATPCALWMDVVRFVAFGMRVPVEHMTGRSRKANHVRARAIAMIALNRRGCSAAQIGRWLGGRDHTTVLHLITKVSDDLSPDEAEIIDRLVPVVEVAA